jgi:hypothetical protein
MRRASQKSRDLPIISADDRWAPAPPGSSSGAPERQLTPAVVHSGRRARFSGRASYHAQAEALRSAQGGSAGLTSRRSKPARAGAAWRRHSARLWNLVGFFGQVKICCAETGGRDACACENCHRRAVGACVLRRATRGGGRRKCHGHTRMGAAAPGRRHSTVRACAALHGRGLSVDVLLCRRRLRRQHH